MNIQFHFIIYQVILPHWNERLGDDFNLPGGYVMFFKCPKATKLLTEPLNIQTELDFGKHDKNIANK
jgi:hypothetical protein